jgi:membrane dipeptidase
MIATLTVAAALLAPLPAEDAALARARAVLRRVPLVDGHNDLPWTIREHPAAPRDVMAYDLRRPTPGQTDLARLAAGQVGGQFWSVYVPGEEEVRRQGFAKVQLEQIDIARQVIAGYPDRLAFALTAADVEREFARGRIASLVGMEGGHVLENSLGALRAFHLLGARYLTLTHNVTLDWADAAAGPGRHGGLTRFGEEVVREMNRLGMLVDLSHASPETMTDALRVSEAPVIFSHSSARALVDVGRNVPDEVLRALPGNGGVVMVTFVPGFVSREVAAHEKVQREALAPALAGVKDAAERRRLEKEYEARHPAPDATLAQVADHVEHVRRVAGVDHVGVGSDFDGIERGPVGLEDVSKFPALLAELARRGWSDADLGKLAGGNILRALRAAEAAARRLQSARPPSTATIEKLDATPSSAARR